MRYPSDSFQSNTKGLFLQRGKVDLKCLPVLISKHLTSAYQAANNVCCIFPSIGESYVDSGRIYLEKTWNLHYWRSLEVLFNILQANFLQQGICVSPVKHSYTKTITFSTLCGKISLKFMFWTQDFISMIPSTLVMSEISQCNQNSSDRYHSMVIYIAQSIL